MANMVRLAPLAPVGDELAGLADLAGLVPALEGFPVGLGLGLVVIPDLAAGPANGGQIQTLAHDPPPAASQDRRLFSLADGGSAAQIRAELPGLLGSGTVKEGR
jgi:hypothetical protein